MNGVYKLVAVRVHATQEEDDKKKKSRGNNIRYKLKTSPGKETYPGPKQIQRITENGKIKKDVIILEGEKEIRGDPGVPLLRKLFDKGNLLCEMPSLWDIQRYCFQQIELLPTRFKDLDFAPGRISSNAQ